MPRPPKPRRICSRPGCTRFGPQGGGAAPVTMSLDEYEVIRLIDLEDFSQEQCAAQMNVARTTVQAIYARARKKLAGCLVDGLSLHIGGGDVQLCEHGNGSCGHGCCRKRRKNKMKIAVTYEDCKVFQHFGQSKHFKLYDTKDGEIRETGLVPVEGEGHGALAGFLKEKGADTLICGGIGDGAKQSLAAAGIILYGGVEGDADQVVADLLAGRLQYNPDVVCSHHGEHGHHH